MHPEASAWVARFATDEALVGLEFGSRDINGSIQGHFPNTTWTGVDIAEGPGCDIVADASTYQHPELVDLVVCCEVFEHTALWPEIVANSFLQLKSGGMAIFTAAGRGRGPHSAVDGCALREGEHYENVDEYRFDQTLVLAGFTDIEVDWIANPGDVRAFGRRP